MLRLEGLVLVEVSPGGGGGRIGVEALFEPTQGGVCVIDCGTELYVWCGRGHRPSDKNAAVRLCGDIKAGRAAWVDVEVIKDRMEPVFCRERFFGWEDEGMYIAVVTYLNTVL